MKIAFTGPINNILTLVQVMIYELYKIRLSMIPRM